MDRIKQIFLKRAYLKIILIFFIIGVWAIYFRTFFSSGAYMDGVFLKKNIIGTENHYIGKSTDGNLHVIVKGQKNKDGSVEMSYRLPNNINRQYIVNFKDDSNWDLGIKNIQDKEGIIIFEGKYTKGRPVLFDKNGEPWMNDMFRVVVGTESQYNNQYKIPIINVVEFATFDRETIRGNYEYLIIAIILTIYILIDIKYPLFFFTLRHWIDVKDPEPSEFYIMMQHIGWAVCPIIIVILMLSAL